MLRVSGHSERSDVGRQRQANEDSYLARAPLFVVADGMGGAQAGEVASLTAIQAFQAGLPGGNPEESIERTIGEANRNIYNQAHADASLAGMGTTITVAAVDSDNERVVIGHVGDSRAYRLRNGIIQRLTKDHSLVEEMRRRGQITEEQAEDHPQRSIITRALGPEPEVQADLATVPSEPGDIFLLCSDGLTTMIGDEQIREILMGATSLDAAVRTLIDEANRAGGRDNITAIVFQVEDPAQPLARDEHPTLIRSGAARRARRAEREADRPPRRVGRAIAGVLAAVAIVFVLVAGLFFATRQAWFLGTDPAGRVALYRGLPYELPFGIDLYSLKYSTAIQTESLPVQRQRSVTDHSLRSEDDATSLIEDIESSEGLTGVSASRNRELLALVPVALLLTLGFAAVFAQNDSQLTNLSLSYGLYFLAICLATHIYIRIRLPDADPYLFPLMALLTAIGLVMLYRLDSETGNELARDQANWFVIGLILFAAVIHFLKDYSVLERYRYTIALISLGLLLAPRVPLIGSQVNGAYLGIKLGPIAFQPAELAKIGIVVFLASYLNEHRELLVVGARRILGITFPPLKHLGPLLVVWGAAMFMLIFIRDLGSSLMFFAAFLALIYVATGRLSFVIIGMGMFLAGAWVIYQTVPHVTDRVDIWLDPYQDPSGAGYQVLQSMFAMADGGLFGEGFAQAMVVIPGTEAPLLPAAQTDLIYTLITSELGLFGGCAIIALYLLIAARGFKTALIANDGFSKLLATGLTAVFAIQAFVIIGGVTRVIPLTGVTLPLVSYGGSSILANFILLALLLLISNKARREAREGI